MQDDVEPLKDLASEAPVIRLVNLMIARRGGLGLGHPSLDLSQSFAGTSPDRRRAATTPPQRFKGADEGGGGVIETEEREDIYITLEEMVYLARHSILVNEIDDWREW